MNKEIKELLNELKDVAERHTIEIKEYGVVETITSSINKELRLNSYSANLLLSYIEQLENNRDKAIELLNKLETQPAYLDCKYYELYGFNEIKNILKGDSE